MSRELYFACAMLATAGLTYLIRLLPMIFIKNKIQSVFVKSFLHYVPYVVLSALSFPAIFYCTENMISCICAAMVCAILAYSGRNLLTCMLGSVVTVLLIEGIIVFI